MANKLHIVRLLIVFSLIFISKLSFPQFPEPIFEHLTIEDGLPENSVICVLQDHLGYLWLGTQNGLVRYDGYNMTVYQPDPEDSLSISDRTVRTIYEDKSRTLWIGTDDGGLNRFDRTTETFTRFMHNPDDSTSINSNNVESIYEDRAGNFWVGGLEGLNLFDKGAEKFSNIRVLLDDKKITVFNRGVGAILEDRLTGRLYVGSGNKILFYDDERELLTQNDSMPGLENELGIIQSFYQAIDGTIWIGHSKGLARFNSLINNIKYYQPVPSLSYNVKNPISGITEDENGFIWGISYKKRTRDLSG